MARRSRIILVLVALLTALPIARAQEPSPEARMADTILSVCLASMRSHQTLSLDQFGDQFAFDHVRGQVTWLKHARGQPWLRLALNSPSGGCGASFSGSADHSFAAAEQLASKLENAQDLRRVSAPGFRAAFTFTDTPEPFDPNRHAYIGYLNVAGFQSFIFVPAHDTP